MIKEIKLPEISESTEAGTVVSVLVSKGDTINADDPIVELETDKASVEVPASDGGKVTEVLVSDGDEVSVGQTILKVETEGEGEAGEEEAEAEEAEGADKEAGEKEQPEAAEEGGGAKKPPAKDKASGKRPSEKGGEAEATEAASVAAAPSTRRLARELGVDITRVSGSGPGGRISVDDVKAYVREGTGGGGADRAAPSGASSGGRGAKPLPDFSQWGSTRRVQQNRIRSLTAENTQYSWQNVPHVTQFDEADVSAVEEFRKEYADFAEKQNAKLTVTSILVKVVAEALKRFPRFNSSLDEANDEVVVKEYVNVGVAVDSDRGLLVPVIHNADRRSLIDIARRLGEVATAARNKKIQPDELQGGTFTISNLGGIGGTAFTPVIFHPQVAILGVARTTTVPIWHDGAFIPRLQLPLTLSYDHRVIDGADGARFLRWICEALEHPMMLHLERETLEGEDDE